ncbi:histidine kinase [Myroides sp. M-43]|uniref:tetratricopeptide repeat-containing sensor histidine kinase n=1 Tax=Myroides oncorhynchi TaxID=2893756 RepID=UPI001E44A021|nr:tetratricopeptide repeat-containing sensor histidine kinase [Myroides oncorhynchi]MCC9044429.1 histidine kinase [Myroides oncorhynchi]
MKYIYLSTLMLLFLLIGCQKTNHKVEIVNNQKLIDNIEYNDKSLPENQYTLDSLFKSIKEKSTNSQQLIDIASKAYNLELYTQYFRYSKEIYQIATKNNDSLLVAKSLWYIGDYHEYKMQLDSAYIYFDKAEQIYQNTNSNIDVAKMKQYKSIILFREGLYNEAENKALEALETLEILDKIPKNKLSYEIYLNLGNILDLNQQPNEALLYYSEALHILEDLYHNNLISIEEFQESKAHSYNNIGNLYLNQKAILNAETYLTYGHNILLDLGIKNELYTILVTNLGTLKTNLAYPNEARKLLLESLTISEDKNYKQSISANNFRLGELALKQKDTLQAIEYYKKAYTYSNKHKASNTILKSLKALSLTNKEESVKYISLYYAFNDSINKLQISKRNKFARIKYESERLQKNIISLKKENSKLLITSIIILLFAIIILFTILYRNKIKKYTFLKQDKENKELIFKLLLDQEQLSQEVLTKERERISQELHDGIINSLFIIRLSLINNSDNNNIIILNEIEKVQNQVRLISHDLKNQEFIQQGFSEILSQLVIKNTTKHQKFQLIISKNHKWDKISYDDKINIYRILQETIQNVIKHSEAKNCIISISKTNTNNKITITDDGVGFNYSKLKNSNGLKNISNRAKQLQAKISVNSTIKGTVYIIDIPH